MAVAATRIVDLSHEIVDGMTAHPGIPPPSISTFVTHEASTARDAPGTTFEIGRIDLDANTGTYLDTPAHRFPGWQDLAGLPLERVVDLDAGIPLVEHLTNLGALSPTGWRFFAVPPRIRTMATFPVRAFAIVGAGGVRPR